MSEKKLLFVFNPKSGMGLIKNNSKVKYKYNFDNKGDLE